MADQLDFGVNWVFMDTILSFVYSTWIISSPVAVAPLYHVMQLTWFL